MSRKPLLAKKPLEMNLAFLIFAYLFGINFALTSSLDVGEVFERGSHEIFSTRLDKDIYEGLDYNLHVYGPNSDGDFPVIYFSSSIAGVLFGNWNKPWSGSHSVS